MDINATAPVITNDEIIIHSSLSKVWDLHTDITRWKEWNKNITKSEIDGQIEIGKTFHWSTAGMDVASTIAEIRPYQKIAWSGSIQGILGIHVWIFTEVPGGVLVQTHESWEGEPVKTQKEIMQKNLDESLRSWLESFKQKAESV